MIDSEISSDTGILGNVVLDVHSGAVVTASQTNMYHELMQGVYRETAFIGDALQVPIPMSFIGNGKEKFRITIENGVVGDTYDYSFKLGK